MGGPSAPVDIETGQKTQSWLAVSNEPAARVSGCYWHRLRQEQPAAQALEVAYQDELLVRLGEISGVALT
jgi:hypothetical protein